MMTQDHNQNLMREEKDENLCEYVVEEVVVVNLRIQILKKNKSRIREKKTTMDHFMRVPETYTLGELRRVVAVTSTIPLSLSYTGGFHSARTALFLKKKRSYKQSFMPKPYSSCMLARDKSETFTNQSTTVTVKCRAHSRSDLNKVIVACLSLK